MTDTIYRLTVVADVSAFVISYDESPDYNKLSELFDKPIDAAYIFKLKTNCPDIKFLSYTLAESTAGREWHVLRSKQEPI